VLFHQRNYLNFKSGLKK